MVVGQNGAHQQEESVYNLIPRVQVQAPKPPRYESKFKSNVRETFKEGKHEHRTMGYAEEPLPDPQQFLKKKQNESKTVTNPAEKKSLGPFLEKLSDNWQFN
ncbi:unnamed protein product [Rotaria sp. Silwood1]|nr:unnamed protein product [Rotaria sp. Silwood1]